MRQVPAGTSADGMHRVKVVEVGGVFGGVAGLKDLYIRAEAVIDDTGDRLIQFLSELAIDSARVDELKHHPDRVMNEAGLSAADIALIKSRDPEVIRKALSDRGAGEASLKCVAHPLLDIGESV